ncbi:mutator type transposase [Tanacetum coccineum]
MIKHTENPFLGFLFILSGIWSIRRIERVIDNEFDPLFSYPDKNVDNDRPSRSNARVSGLNIGKRPMVIEEVDGTYSSVASEDSEDSDDSDFDVGDEDRIEDVDVDMADFRKHTDGNVEWVEYDNEGERKKALKKLAKAHRPVDGQMYTENFYVGQTLANKQLIKVMVSRISVEQRRQLYFTRNDKIRMRAECRGLVPVFGNGPGASGLGDNGPIDSGPVCDKPKLDSGSNKKTKKKETVEDSIKCPWLLHCSKSHKAETWWVKIFNDNHTCLQSRTVGKCTASFLSKEVKETIKPNPKVPISALKDQLQRKYELGMSDMKVFMVKQMAEERVIGDWVKQYAQLRQYALELKEKNPDTTIKIDVERCFDVASETRQFKRIYICLGALKNGFKAGKRDLLGLDGCFLSGPYPGQILTAIGVDPNNGIYPLAYAVVESETKDSWLWFLDCLGDDLELFRNSNFTFISDRQKGLIPALQETFPAAEHRYCLKHIYDNMKLQWRGEQYKDLLWRCATATTVQRFGKNMEEIKKFNKEMYEWLKEIPPQHWARSYFSGRPDCDVLLNNMCEVLNRQLLNGKDKPIRTCLEFIREYLMKRIVIVQGVIGKSVGPLTPNATKVFNSIKKDAAQYKVIWNGGDLYDTTGPHGDKCVVNITLRSCACKKWEITGMPCKHEVAAIWNMASNGLEPGIPESWVHETYWLKTWEEMYSYKINPCNGPDMWLESDNPITLTPPNYKPPIGRPPKKRRKSATKIYD